MNNVDTTRLRCAVKRIDGMYFVTKEIWSHKWNRYIHDVREGKAASPVKRKEILGYIDNHQNKER